MTPLIVLEFKGHRPYSRLGVTHWRGDTRGYSQGHCQLLSGFAAEKKKMREES